MKPKPLDTLQVRLPTLTPAGLGGGAAAVSTGSSGCGGRGFGVTCGPAWTPLRPTSTFMAQLLTGFSLSEIGTPATKSLRLGLAAPLAAARTRSAAWQNACASLIRRSSALEAMSVLNRL